MFASKLTAFIGSGQRRSPPLIIGSIGSARASPSGGPAGPPSSAGGDVPVTREVHSRKDVSAPAELRIGGQHGLVGGPQGQRDPGARAAPR